MEIEEKGKLHGEKREKEEAYEKTRNKEKDMEKEELDNRKKRKRR